VNGKELIFPVGEGNRRGRAFTFQKTKGVKLSSGVRKVSRGGERVKSVPLMITEGVKLEGDEGGKESLPWGWRESGRGKPSEPKGEKSW